MRSWRAALRDPARTISDPPTAPPAGPIPAASGPAAKLGAVAADWPHPHVPPGLSAGAAGAGGGLSAGMDKEMASLLHGDPPPPASAFGGSCLLVRAPQSALRTALSPEADAHGSGTIPVHCGLSAQTEFETDLFQGRLRVVFKMPEGQQAPEAAAMLAGKKRQMWVMIQVSFFAAVGGWRAVRVRDCYWLLLHGGVAAV